MAADWIAGFGLAVLFAGWSYMLREQGPPIAAAAFSSQWLQVMVGVVYVALTGRIVPEMRLSDYRPMVLLGLGCVAMLFGGFYFTARFGGARKPGEAPQQPLPWSTYQIGVVYIGVVAIAGILQELAWSTSGLTQLILVLSRVRYVFLFLLVTRLATPTLRWPWIAAILLAEVAIEFGGFFADFREPLVVVGIAILGAMDRRRASTWIMIGSVAALAIVSALVWTAIKPVVRRQFMSNVSTTERLNAVATVTVSKFSPGGRAVRYQTDSLVSRIWVVYYPALALKRVPSIVPHENGRILWGAVRNVLTPRLFFRNKSGLPSQSDEVRQYAGVKVKGRETNTSFAFGYAGESYVDFGIPLMFLPVFVFGFLVGLAYRWLNASIRYDELRTGVTAVIFWSVLGSYETSWVMMIGPTLTILTVLGGGAVLVDRTLRARENQHWAGASARRLAARSWVPRT